MQEKSYEHITVPQKNIQVEEYMNYLIFQLYDENIMHYEMLKTYDILLSIS